MLRSATAHGDADEWHWQMLNFNQRIKLSGHAKSHVYMVLVEIGNWANVVSFWAVPEEGFRHSDSVFLYCGQMLEHHFPVVEVLYI